MPDDELPSPPSEGGVISRNRGVVESLSAGMKHLFMLDEKLADLAEEDAALRHLVMRTQRTAERLVGIVEQMERRFEDRLDDLDKRLAEIDRRIALQIELSVRNEVDRRLGGPGKSLP